MVNFGPGDPDNGKFSYSGVLGTTRDVLFSWHGYHMPAGVFLSENTDPCQWLVSCRERLCPREYLLAVAIGSDAVLNAVSIVAEPNPWESYRQPSGPDSSITMGPFFLWNENTSSGGGALGFRSWRSILKAAECSVLPPLKAAGFLLFPEEGIEGGLLFRLEQAREMLQSWDPAPPYAMATAMDRAVAFTLSGGIRFGVESDPRSPYWNQLVIFEGGEFESETVDDMTTTWLVSSPWTLVSGDADLPTFGAALRFERTDDNDTLPPWIELELVRI